MKKLFARLYGKIRFPYLKKRPNTKDEVSFAFTSNNIDYYRFVDNFNIPIERACAAQDIYAELEQKTDTLWHEVAYKAIIESLEQGKNVTAGAIAYNSLERIQRKITNLDLVYKLASVIYFDANENPYRYSSEYNATKILSWKKDKDIEGFFLKMQLTEYLPSLNGSKINLEEFIREQRIEQLQTLKFQLTTFSEKEKQTDLYIRAKLWVEIQESLIALEK